MVGSVWRINNNTRQGQVSVEWKCEEEESTMILTEHWGDFIHGVDDKGVGPDQRWE